MKNNHHIIGSICLGVVFCLAFYMLMGFTPLFADDYNSYFIFGTDRRIASFRDIFISPKNYYLLNNGRFIPHFFVQLFDGLLGKSFFNIVNTLVFGVFIILLLSINNKEWCLLPVVIALILVLMPGFNNEFLWLSGACNYLWAAVLLLLFYRLLMQESIKVQYYPFLLLFGILCGWTNEALIVGFVAGCLCYYAVHRKELTMHRVILLIGLIIGAIFLVFAPGSIHRFLEGKEGVSMIAGIGHQLFSSLLAMDNLRLLPLLLLILVLAFIFKKIPQGFFSDNLLWFVAVGISFVFILLTGHQAAHSRFGIELFSLIVILKLLGHYTIPRSLVALCVLVAIGILAQTLYYSYRNHQEYKRCIAQIGNTETGIIETNEVKWPSFFDRLIVRFKSSEESDYYVFQDDWIDKFFGKKNLLFLPHRFMDRLRNDKSSFEEFEVNTDLPFYAKHTDTDSVSMAVFYLSELKAGDIPFLLRPFANKMERYSAKEVKSSKVEVITLPQGRFVLVMKNHMIADRVNSIILQ